MATPAWVGVAGNWATATEWDGGLVPVDGDTVYFAGTSVVSVTAGLTLGAAGDAFAGLFVGEDYSGSIGTSGSKLIAGGTGITTIRMAARGGKLFINTPATTDCNLAAAGGVTDFFELAGTCTNINAVGCAGSWSITNGAAITNIRQDDSPNCTCTIGTGVTALNLIRCWSGRMVNGSAVSGTTNPGYLEVKNSTYLQDTGTTAIAYAIAAEGGVLQHKAGNITNLVIGRGGVFDGRLNRNKSVTITNLWLHSGGRLHIKNALNTYAVTNVHNFGGYSDVELAKTTAI